MNKKVLLIAAGGTISSKVDPNTGVTVEDKDAATKDLNEALASSIKYLENRNSISINLIADNINFFEDSSNVTSDVWKKLSDKIYDNYDDYDGFIITHGTNTLGYTAAALSFALTNIGKPVVLTGAQIGIYIPGSDSVMNLENTLRVVVHPDAPVGVAVCFGSYVIKGTKAKKSNSFDYDAFKSFSRSKLLGRVARVIDWSYDEVSVYSKFYEAHAERQVDLVVQNNFDTRIASFTENPGIPIEIYKAAIEVGGARGIILRAYGVGDSNSSLFKFFDFARYNEIPVIVTTQAPEGNARGDINEPGIIAGKDHGVIHIYNMSMESIFTKMAWLLGNGTPYKLFKREMQKSYKGEIDIKKDVKSI